MTVPSQLAWKGMKPDESMTAQEASQQSIAKRMSLKGGVEKFKADFVQNQCAEFGFVYGSRWFWALYALVIILALIFGSLVGKLVSPSK